MKGDNLVLMVGCGDLGIRCGRLLLTEGRDVAGIRRNPGALPGDFGAFAADYTAAASLDFIEALEPACVLASFNPTERSVQGYREGFVAAMANLLRGLGRHRPQLVTMVSSTRVYREAAGGWVDETSPLSEDDERALCIIEAERLLLDSPLAACVVRCGGIYGYPQGRLLQRIARGDICPEQPTRYSNRIHRDDCAGFLAHLMRRAGTGEAVEPVYTAVDDLPAAQYEVESWLARQMGVGPVTGRAEPAVAAPRSHKRCSNRLLRASGYDLLYPDYRSGYTQVLGLAP